MTDAIASDHVVGYKFTIRGHDGQLLAESADDVAYYLHGTGTSPVGLEKHMTGRKPGEKFSATLEPADAFGEREEEQSVVVPRGEFPADAELEPGMHIVADTPEGQSFSMWVTDVSDTEVVLDANHPLAGLTLHVDVEIVSIRSATEEEIAHGHTHEGGHEH